MGRSFPTADVRRSAHGSREHRPRVCSTSAARLAIGLENGLRSSYVRPRPPARFVVSSTTASGAGLSEELAELDLSRAGEAIDQRLVLICGHGTRDACCALRGTAVYAALEPGLEPNELWISSHHGGHRFAANALVLPVGIHLGRLTPDDAPHAVARALAGLIELERYRGRTAYAQPVQAGERAVREAGGFFEVSDLRLVEADGDRARFRSREDREYATVATQTEGPIVPASCGAQAEPQVVYSARLV